MHLVIPKYFPKELTSLVKCKIDSMNLKKASSVFSVDKALLNEVIEGAVSFRLPHYKVISKITGLTVEHLVSYDNIDHVECDDCSNNLRYRINVISSFFSEVSMLKRM